MCYIVYFVIFFALSLYSLGVNVILMSPKVREVCETNKETDKHQTVAILMIIVKFWHRSRKGRTPIYFEETIALQYTTVNCTTIHCMHYPKDPQIVPYPLANLKCPHA